MRDRQQGGAERRDTVYGHTMCSWRALKFLETNMLRKLRTPSHRIWQALLASIDSSDESNTGVTTDAGRYGTENMTHPEGHPVVESTQIGGVLAVETARGGPRRAVALP